MSDHAAETRRRRTFAVISHADAGKTTLTDVCRLRDTPIMCFINKLDREGRSPFAASCAQASRG